MFTGNELSIKKGLHMSNSFSGGNFQKQIGGSVLPWDCEILTKTRL